VHRECFESLRGRAGALLGEGLPPEEALRRLLAERYRPPSVAYEALKSATRGRLAGEPATEGIPGGKPMERPEEAVRPAKGLPRSTGPSA